MDRTNQADTLTYGHQIIYTPRHSGGGTLRWENPIANLTVQAMVVGSRYALPQNIETNRLPAYCDLTLGIDHTFPTRFGKLHTRMQILNMLDVQYEVVRSYPMMGRNFRVSIVYEI